MRATRKRSRSLTCSSAACRTAAATPLWQACSSSSRRWTIWPSRRRILSICAPPAFLTRNSSAIWRISACTATSGPSRRACPSSPTSPSSRWKAPPSSASCWKRCCWSPSTTSASLPPRPTASSAPPRAAPSWSSAPAARKGMTPPTTAPAPPTSAAAAPPPASWRRGISAFRPPAPWPTAGCRCSPASTTPSKNMPSCTRTPVCCWWTPTTC